MKPFLLGLVAAFAVGLVTLGPWVKRAVHLIDEKIQKYISHICLLPNEKSGNLAKLKRN